jgi:tetratricopeptide (TPR) repeat protein
MAGTLLTRGSSLELVLSSGADPDSIPDTTRATTPKVRSSYFLGRMILRILFRRRARPLPRFLRQSQRGIQGTGLPVRRIHAQRLLPRSSAWKSPTRRGSRPGPGPAGAAPVGVGSRPGRCLLRSRRPLAAGEPGSSAPGLPPLQGGVVHPAPGLEVAGEETAEEWELAAGLWMETGSRDSAQHAWRKVLSLDPHSREALAGPGHHDRSPNRPAEAARLFARLAEEYGAQAAPIVERASALWMRANLSDSALAFLERRWQEWHSPADGENLARFLLGSGQADSAANLLDSLSELAPEDSPRLELMAARALLAGGHRSEALERFRQMESEDPTDTKIRVQPGRASCWTWTPCPQARADLRNGLRSLDSTDAIPYYFLGLWALKSDLPDSARYLPGPVVGTRLRRDRHLDPPRDAGAGRQQARRRRFPSSSAWRELAPPAAGPLPPGLLLRPSGPSANPPHPSGMVAPGLGTRKPRRFAGRPWSNSTPPSRSTPACTACISSEGIRAGEPWVDWNAARTRPATGHPGESGRSQREELPGLHAGRPERIPPMADSLIEQGRDGRSEESRPTWIRKRLAPLPRGSFHGGSRGRSTAPWRTAKSDPTLKVHKASILEALHRPAEARALWQAVLQADPGSPEAIKGLDRTK